MSCRTLRNSPKVCRELHLDLPTTISQLPFISGNYEIAFRVAYCNLDRILRSADWPHRYGQYLSSRINDGRPQGSCMDNHRSSHCMLAGSHKCAECGCAVPAQPVTSENTDPAAESLAAQGDVSQFADLDDSDQSCESKPSPSDASTALVEKRLTSQITMTGSLTSSLKHAASSFFSTTSRICSQLLAATGAVSPANSSSASRNTASTEGGRRIHRGSHCPLQRDLPIQQCSPAVRPFAPYWW